MGEMMPQHLTKHGNFHRLTVYSSLIKVSLLVKCQSYLRPFVFEGLFIAILRILSGIMAGFASLFTNFGIVKI